jgi:hypothetical protein
MGAEKGRSRRRYCWALFDRAVVHMPKERVLLPGITVLTRLDGFTGAACAAGVWRSRLNCAVAR